MTDDGIEVRLARPGDAAGIAGLLRERYGDRYADGSYLDATALAGRLSRGESLFAVAVREGSIVAQLAADRRSPFAWEIGRGLVQPAFRQRGLLAPLNDALEDELRRDPRARLCLGRAVTHHDYMQRHARRQGFTPLGLLLGLWPSDAIEGAPTRPHAVSALVSGKTLRPLRPRRLAFGGRPRARAVEALAGLGVPVSQHLMRLGPELGLELETTPALGLVHLRLVPRAGAPGAGLIDAVARAEAGARLLWADVPAEHPAAERLVPELERLGFAFGAYLPLAGPSGEDVLRLQRHEGPPIAAHDIHVIEEAHALRAVILSDVSDARAAVRA